MDDDNIYFEKQCVDLLGFTWCHKRFCNIDGCLSNYLLDVKNKRKRDGSGENFVKYSHDLGLIVGKTEVQYMDTLRSAFRLKNGYFAYYFENGIYAVEAGDAIRHGIVAPSHNHEVYYVPFDLWQRISSQEELLNIKPTYDVYKCIGCGQDSFKPYHDRCRMKIIDKRIKAHERE